MARKSIKKTKPSLAKFAEVVEVCRGVISKIAEALQVDRTTIYNWCNKDPRYQAVIDNHKGKFLDECLKSGRILALGIPKLDAKKQVIGWKERPDGQMLRYFISTLGRREGFGEQIDVTSKGESIKPDPIVVEVIDNREKVIRADDTEDNNNG